MRRATARHPLPLGGVLFLNFYATISFSEFLEDMKQVLTLVAKLQPTLEQRQLLDDTAQAFADACNWINQNVRASLTNKNSIQSRFWQAGHSCYQEPCSNTKVSKKGLR